MTDKKKRRLYDGSPHDLSDAQLWAGGKTKDGKDISTRIKPKKRISYDEAKILELFVINGITSLDKAKIMRQVFDLFQDKWPSKYFGTNQCSAALLELKSNFFLNFVPGRQTQVDKNTEAVRPTRKAKYWLSDKVQNGNLTIDANRWVIEDGTYIADELTRAKAEARESKEDKADTA